MRKEKKKKKSQEKWLKEITLKEFRDVFVNWYLPAIKSKFYKLEKRLSKLESPGK